MHGRDLDSRRSTGCNLGSKLHKWEEKVFTEAACRAGRDVSLAFPRLQQFSRLKWSSLNCSIRIEYRRGVLVS